MSDTGEQGYAHQDPARRGGVGGGAVPDDQSEGQVERTDEATDEGATDGAGEDGQSTGGARGPSASSPKTAG